MLVIEENQSYDTVIGSGSVWAYLNSVANSYAYAQNYYSNAHPSIPNYFELTTGQPVTYDNSVTPQTFPVAVDNLARRMLAAGVSFKVYAEGIPNAGYVGGDTGNYVCRHQPFSYFTDILDNSNIATETIVPFTQFATDLAAGTLPQFSLVIPDIQDDAHTGTPAAADAWLNTNIKPLFSYASFQPGGSGLLLVTFDEAAQSDLSSSPTDPTGGGGHIATVLAGPNVKTGYAGTGVYQHQSLLLLIMQSLGLPNPLSAAATAPSMVEFFK